MKPYVIVAEDEESLATLLHYNLEKEGYEVSIAEDGEDALTLIRERMPHLVILDWMMPRLSGVEVCRRLRRHEDYRSLPIMLLTARGEESDRVNGLDVGADDYVTKPFSMPELLARIRALLRRAQPGLLDNVVRQGPIELDSNALRVHVNGVEVHLGPTEYRLLDHFMRKPGRVFSREQLLDAVWGHDVYVEARTVDVHIGRLRKALKSSGKIDPIRTVRSAGYAFEISALP